MELNYLEDAFYTIKCKECKFAVRLDHVHDNQRQHPGSYQSVTA